MKASERLHPVDFRALSAAARVAGLLSLGACASRDAAAPVQATSDGHVPVTFAEALPPAGSEEVVETPPPEDPVESCRALAKDSFDQEGQMRRGVDAEKLRGCCQTIAEAQDEAQRRSTPGQSEAFGVWETRYQCCEMLEWRGSMACTPWGPPAPAAFDLSDQTRAPSEPWDIDWREAVAQEARELGAAQDPELRAIARETWRGRMINETVSSRVFEALASQLERGGFAVAEVARWSAFADEERRHGQLCGMVVEALGGEARARSKELASVPRHADVDARQGALRNVLSVACLSETVAVALIGAEREDMPEGPLRELLTEIYRDEVGHARSGWRLLESVLAREPERKADLRRYLPVALDEMIRFELEHLPLAGPARGAAARWPASARRWGLCSGERARRMLFATVEEVLEPRLAALLA